LSRRTATIYLTLAIIIWNGILAGVGFIFGHNWETVTGFVTIYNQAVIGILILVAAIWGAWLYKRSKTAGTA
jgi:membrane protein DedA with SNARE-associated domain